MNPLPDPPVAVSVRVPFGPTEGLAGEIETPAVTLMSRVAEPFAESTTFTVSVTLPVGPAV